MNLVRAAILAGAILPGAVAAQARVPAVAAAQADAPGAGAQEAPATALRLATALEPDTVLSPVGGPRIVLLSSPGVGVAALRLAVPLREGAVEAGAGQLLAELALERMRTLARPVGAQVSVARTPWGLAYSVVGAAADFEYLAYLLREAVSAPDVAGAGFAEALRRLQDRAAVAVETPAGRIAAELWAQFAPGTPPLDGTPASVRSADAARVREVWLRSHQSSAMTLVVSAPLVPEVVLAATRGMGAPEETAAPPPDAPAPSAPRLGATQSLRSWYGEGWAMGPPGDPRAAVLAFLVADQLRGRGPEVEAFVELWDLPDHQALAVIGAAWPRNAQAMRRTVSGALVAARNALDEPTVAAAVARARRELLWAARTPAGMVATVGRAMEADGNPLSAGRYVEALSSMDLVSVRDLLEQILAQRPRTSEVRP